MSDEGLFKMFPNSLQVIQVTKSHKRDNIYILCLNLLTTEFLGKI